MTEFDGTLGNTLHSASRATWWGVGGNVVLSCLKIVVGIVSASTALVADGLHSSSDVVSSLIVLAGLRLARRPADDEHPYGHGKYEVLAAKLVSIILMVVGAAALYGGIIVLREGVQREVPGNSALLVALVSIGVKEGLFRYKSSVARRTGSRALLADAWHHRSDALSSVVSLLAVGGTIVGGSSWGFLDPVGAVVIGVIIFWTGAFLYVRSSQELLDTVLDGPPLDLVRHCAARIEGVRAVEKAYVRKAGLDLLVDLHIHVDPESTVREGHRIGHAVKSCVMDAMPAVKSMLVHVEPWEDGDGGDPSTTNR